MRKNHSIWRSVSIKYRGCSGCHHNRHFHPAWHLDKPTRIELAPTLAPTLGFLTKQLGRYGALRRDGLCDLFG